MATTTTDENGNYEFTDVPAGTYTVWVNLGWGLLNLAPVLPLDGGHIASTAAASFARWSLYGRIVETCFLDKKLSDQRERIVSRVR